MRWIFFSLVLANIGFYVWHSVEASQKARYEELNASVSSSSTVMSGRPLLLVSELSEQEKADLSRRPDKAIDLMPPAPAPAPVVEKQPEVEKSATATVNVGDIPLVTEAGQCLILGPVSDSQYDQIAQRLLARTIVPERRLIEAAGTKEYWVILPPFDDKNDAVRKLQELQGRGVQGQIVPAGKLANAISFGGIYSDKSAAETFANQMRSKGVKVEIEAIPQIRQEKWVALSERQTPKLTQEIWGGLQADFPSLKKNIQHCN